MVLSDSFIEDVITTEKRDNTTMISREFNGMEAVARFDEQREDSEEVDE